MEGIPSLLSQHIKHYGSARRHILDRYLGVASNKFTVDMVVTAEGSEFLTDTLQTIINVYLEARGELAKVKDELAALQTAAQGLGGPSTAVVHVDQ